MSYGHVLKIYIIGLTLSDLPTLLATLVDVVRAKAACAVNSGCNQAM
jgi:hypothetical protein